MSEILQEFRPAALVEAIEANLFAQWAYLERAPGVEVRDEGKSLRFTTGLPHPICNGVLRARLGAEEAEAEIEKAVTHFRNRRLPFTWWLGPSTRPANLGERLEARGFTSLGAAVGMAVDLHAMEESLPVPPGLAIEHIGDRETLRQACRVLFAGFGMPESLTGPWMQIVAELGLEPERPFRGFLARQDGKPAATAWLFLAEGVAGIYTVATHPEARRRGLGSAVTLAALRAGRATGYRIGILQASLMGEPVYRRIGFQEYCRLPLYSWPAEVK